MHLGLTTLARSWRRGAALVAAGSAATGPAQAVAPPACLELETRAVGRPGAQQLVLEQTAHDTAGRVRWRSPELVTTDGRWRWHADTLALEVATTQRLAGARGALDPRGWIFHAALVPAAGAWVGTAHQDVPGVASGAVEAARGRPCPEAPSP